VGDLRNRLLALADASVHGNLQVYRLLAHRLPEAAADGELQRELRRLVDGDHPLAAAVPGPMRRIICTHLRMFAERMPSGFDLRGASIGNLILAGGYLHHDRDIDAVLFLFSKLVQVRGRVLLVADVHAHLAARLADGERVVGQHRLGGKHGEGIRSAVADLALVRDLEQGEPVAVRAEPKVLDLIGRADLVCYPMGSFFSSLVANLLPDGVGRAVARADCPKVYVPNTGVDPEQKGLSVADCTRKLLEYVRRDAGPDVAAPAVLHFVIVDSRHGCYPDGLDPAAIAALGAGVLDVPLVTPRSAPHLDPQQLAEILLSLA
jgi:CofD-related protein of GAK system